MGNNAGSLLKDACADSPYLSASHNFSFLLSFYVVISDHTYLCSFLQALPSAGVLVVEKENYSRKSNGMGLAYNYVQE